MTHPCASVFTQLVLDPPAGSRLHAHVTLPPRVEASRPLPGHWPAWLLALAHAHGVSTLSEPQGQALQLIERGQHVCLSLPTGGGRGLVRLLAMYHALAGQPRGRGLMLFPHKPRELAQYSAFLTWNAALPVAQRLRVAVYDGETPGTQRRAVKQDVPQLVLTTPEMVHAGILAYHGGWRALFQDLRYIVLADVHLCAGALGSHLAHLLRRLQRLALHYGAQPQYLLTSAPLGHADEVSHMLTAQSCTVVTGGAWRAQQQHRAVLGVTGDPIAVCQALVARHQAAALPVVVCAPRALVPQLQEAVLPQVIPQETLLATRHAPIAASAIFLGAPAILGHWHDYLSLMASHYAESLGCLVLTGATPVERYVLHTPVASDTTWPQGMALHPGNPCIASRHLHCAAAELALAAGERYAGIHGVGRLMQQLAQERRLERRTEIGAWVATERYPHRRLALRAYEPSVALINRVDGRYLTRLAPGRAFRECFEGAVYREAGRAWRVERVLAERRRVLLQPTTSAEATRARVTVSYTAPSVEASMALDAWQLTYGACLVTETRTAFTCLDPQTQARHSVHVMPAQQRQYPTQSLRLTWTATPTPPTTTAWHTVLHALLAAFPILMMRPSEALRGSVCQSPAESGVVFYDTTAGGDGSSALLYREHARCLRVALQLLQHCACTAGCPGCLTGVECDTCLPDATLHRQAGIDLLQRLLGEVLPPFESVREAHAVPPSPAKEGPRHVYLTLTTQQSAEEVGGWQHKHLLGLGVAVTYDTQEERYRVYTAETVQNLLADLQAADLVLGFNTHDFDYQVLQPYTTLPLHTLPTLAVLDSVQQALGFRVSLGHLLKETLATDRPDDSLRTLTWYQEGAREHIVQQCRRDLDLLRALLHYAQTTGKVWYRDQAGTRRPIPLRWSQVCHHG